MRGDLSALLWVMTQEQIIVVGGKWSTQKYKTDTFMTIEKLSVI